MLAASSLLTNVEVRLLSNVIIRAAVDAWVNSARMLRNASVRAAIDAGPADLRQQARTSLRTASLRTPARVNQPGNRWLLTEWKPAAQLQVFLVRSTVPPLASASRWARLFSRAAATLIACSRCSGVASASILASFGDGPEPVMGDLSSAGGLGFMAHPSVPVAADTLRCQVALDNLVLLLGFSHPISAPFDE
jgi:hypothetical protein